MMSTKKGRHRKNTGLDPLEEVFAEMGLNPEDWTVSVSYTKGVLSGARGTVVEVANRKTGEKKRRSAVSATKRQARGITAQLVRQCILDIVKKE